MVYLYFSPLSYRYKIDWSDSNIFLLCVGKRQHFPGKLSFRSLGSFFLCCYRLRPSTCGAAPTGRTTFMPSANVVSCLPCAGFLFRQTKPRLICRSKAHVSPLQQEFHMLSFKHTNTSKIFFVGERKGLFYDLHWSKNGPSESHFILLETFCSCN